MGKSAQGTGRSKQEARSAAAKIIIDALDEKGKKKAAPQQKKRATPKPSVAQNEKIGEANTSPKKDQKPIKKESHQSKKKPAWQKKHL